MPLIKPDLTLVNLLQTEDLLQIDPAQPAFEKSYRRDPAARSVLRAWFPNLTDLAYRERAQQVAEREKRSDGAWSLLQTRWKSDFAEIAKKLDAPTQALFDDLPPPMQSAFANGELAPILLFMMIDAFRLKAELDHSLPTESPTTQSRIRIVASCLERIERVNKVWEGRTLVLSVPSMVDNDPFGAQVWRNVFRSTYDLRRDDMRADEANCQAAALAGLSCHVVTEEFRNVSWNEPLFYPLDTHMTARGNEVYADLITPLIEQALLDLNND